MKIVVISDSHGNILNIKHVMGFAKKINAKAIIHCGDWDDKESVDAVLLFNIPLYAVTGNADIDHDVEETLRFNAKKFDTDFLIFEIDGRKIGVTHQLRQDDKRVEGLNIVFSGHYHKKDEQMINFVKFIRPGALINGISFVVYETTTNEVEFFENE